MQRAEGTFEVKIQPLEASPQLAGEGLARMSLDKVFDGDMIGTGSGEMLSAMGGVDGSASYVAIERIDATLGGRSGSFVLRHAGTMRRGEPSLSVEVVPDSGRGELMGLEGRLAIDIVDGVHRYSFDYSLPGDAPAD